MMLPLQPQNQDTQVLFTQNSRRVPILKIYFIKTNMVKNNKAMTVKIMLRLTSGGSRLGGGRHLKITPQHTPQDPDPHHWEPFSV